MPWHLNFACKFSCMNTKLLPGVMMLLLSITCVAFILTGLLKALRKTAYTRKQQNSTILVTAAAVTGWMLLTGVLAANGFFANFSALPPRPALLVIVPLPFVLIAAFSKKFTAILMATPPQWIIGMQVFRIVVELLLFRAYTINLLPKQMTFEGGNLDIFSGILAIPAAIMLRKKYRPGLVRLYNIIGLLLLLNILVIAVLSMPTPLRKFMNEPANTIIGEFPFIYLPGVLVVIAYSLHIFSLRQLRVLNNKKVQNAVAV